MNKQRTTWLLNRYPKIFRQHTLPMTETCMCWGLDCGDGWYHLIDRLCRQLQWDIDRNHYPQIEATQVKEKFGTLRFYYEGVVDPLHKRKIFVWNGWKFFFKKWCWRFSGSTMKFGCFEVHLIDENRIRQTGQQAGMISFAEYLSCSICERCGSTEGTKQTNRGWVVTLCKKCLVRRKRHGKS